MEILIYNDPLVEPYSIEDNRKFGEIFCDNKGIFTYRCDFCPRLMRHVNDVENHFFTHFTDIFQPKSETNQSTLINVGQVDESVKVCEDESDHISTSKNLEIATGHTSNDSSLSDTFRFGDVVTRYQEAHALPWALECDTCGTNTKNRKDLKKHMRTHGTVNAEMKHNYQRSTQNGTKSLIKRLLIDRNKDKKTTNASQKLKRKKSVKPIINCQFCDKEFHCQTYLDKHIENHSFYPTIFECDICSKRVKERKDFIEHMKRAHIGIKYPCKVCGKEFAQSSYVLIHMRMHSQDRGHQCAVCGKTFFTSGALTSHMRKHNNTMNELPCNVCGKIFHLPGALADHVRVHTGEKPFKCDFANCSNWFRTKKFLNQHKFVHLEVKQFACEICGMKFKQASGKRVHKRKVHGKLVGTEKRCRTFLDAQIT